MTKAEIQLIRSLDDKRVREEAGLFVAEGEKLVGELLGSDFRVRKIYSTNPFSSETHGERISTKEMERMSHLKTPTDVLVLVEIPQAVRESFDPATLRGQLALALDGVQNPGNMGTIIRLADWFGIRRIVCSPDSADCWSPKVVQATMGAITRVEVHYGDLAEMIEAIGNANISAVGVPTPVYGTFLDGENIYSANLSTEGIIVLGSEGRGISPEIERSVTRKLLIPPYTPAAADSSPHSHPESLNVAIAAAIVCSEFRRRT